MKQWNVTTKISNNRLICLIQPLFPFNGKMYACCHKSQIWGIAARQSSIVTLLIRYKGILQEIVTHPGADFLPAGSRYLRKLLASCCQICYIEDTKKGKPETRLTPKWIALTYVKPSLLRVMAAIFFSPGRSCNTIPQGRKWIFQPESNQGM